MMAGVAMAAASRGSFAFALPSLRFRTGILRCSSSSSASPVSTLLVHVSSVSDVAAAKPPEHLSYLLNMLQARGETIISPAAKEGLIPHVIPLSESPSGLDKNYFNSVPMASTCLQPLHVTAARAASLTLIQDGGVTALVLAGAYSLVLAFESLSKQNLIQQSLSRKVVHVLSGLLFLSSWPFFSSSVEARYFAAVVPLVNCIRLVIYGLCFVTDEGLIKSITREGKPEELLRGPLYYVLVLMFSALIFWRDSPVGILVLAMMSGGDGFADIVGRRFGALKLPYNKQKSWMGSISMFIFGFISSIAMLYYFSAFGYIHLDWGNAVVKVAMVALVATLVESLPICGVIDDNISVPVSTMLTAMLAFGYVSPH